MMSPCTHSYDAPSYFYEWDGSSFISVPGPPRAQDDPSYVGVMLLLPTGQVLFTDQSTDVEIYTPSGSPNPAWQPLISGPPNTVLQGQTYRVYGTQFNGLSQGSMYGDDVQNASNYPLIRVTNSSNQVTYWRTHDHSTMGVATGSTQVYTNFDVPLNMPTGNYNLEVVANGIASPPYPVTVCSSGGC